MGDEALADVVWVLGASSRGLPSWRARAGNRGGASATPGWSPPPTGG